MKTLAWHANLRISYQPSKFTVRYMLVEIISLLLSVGKYSLCLNYLLAQDGVSDIRGHASFRRLHIALTRFKTTAWLKAL